MWERSNSILCHVTTRCLIACMLVLHLVRRIAALPAGAITVCQRLAIGIASERWYLWGFIPCNAGLWSLGLYCWNKPVWRWSSWIMVRLFSYACFFFGFVLFLAGFWRFALILLLIRFLLWLDSKLQLDKPLLPSGDVPPWKIGDHPLDRMALLFIGLVFLVFAINKERMLDFTDPSDHFYHMAVAQKILEYGGIPLWDDWEFAPVGRPHLYPPLLHLLIAFFAGTPDQILLGFATIQMLLYPTALLSYWFLYRTFLSPSLAYLSIIALSMEFMFTIGCLIGLPASVVNVLWSLILLSIYKRKKYLATLLLTAAFYTHTGMPVLICLSLCILGLWKREFLGQVLFVIIGAILLSTPWTVRYLAFSDWMQTNGAAGYSLSSILSRLLWLQIINPVFVLLTIWGWFRLKDAGLFRTQVIGFLPMLTQYGGRFFMHGTPFLAPFIASHFDRWLCGTITRRRALGFLLLTLLPLPCISYMESGSPLQFKFFPGITATHVSLYYTLHRQTKDSAEIQALAEAIQENTTPDTIIHLPDEGMYHFGDMIVVLTSRATDTGGWGEVRKPEMIQAIRQHRENTHSGVFVSRHRENIPSSRCIEQIGSFYIGFPSSELFSDGL